MEFSLHPIKREIELEGFNSIYYFEFGKDFSHPPEKHDFWEMVYVDSGEINAVTDGLGRTLSQGQVIFHRPLEVHAHISNRIVSNNMLVVAFSSKSDSMDFFDRKVFTLGKTARTLLSLFIREAGAALGKIPSDYSNRNPLDFSSAPLGSMQLLECYLTELLLVLMRGEDASSRLKRSDDARELAQSSLAELIAAYLAENVYTSLSLADLCRRFYMGKSQLSKLFCEQMGVGPIGYFHRLKIAEAKKLLAQGDIGITAASDRLGYSSIHNFSRAFKREVGISPSEYRKKLHP